jgi:hypothetical protein
MATATYDNLWSQAMGELSEQLHVEGVDDDEGGGPGEAAPQREDAVAAAIDDRVQYQCGNIEITSQALILKWFWFPFGQMKTIDFSTLSK